MRFRIFLRFGGFRVSSRNSERISLNTLAVSESCISPFVRRSMLDARAGAGAGAAAAGAGVVAEVCFGAKSARSVCSRSRMKSPRISSVDWPARCWRAAGGLASRLRLRLLECQAHLLLHCRLGGLLPRLCSITGWLRSRLTDGEALGTFNCSKSDRSSLPSHAAAASAGPPAGCRLSSGNCGNQFSNFRSVRRKLSQVQDGRLGRFPHFLRNVKADFLYLVRDLRGQVSLTGPWRSGSTALALRNAPFAISW